LANFYAFAVAVAEVGYDKGLFGLVVLYSLFRKSAALAAAPNASETVSRTSFGLKAQPHAKIPVTSESTGVEFRVLLCDEAVFT